MATSLLSEHRRSQLDSIVMKMEANGEKPETIQFVVNDFKTKYAGGSEQPQADNRGMLRKGWDALKVPEQKSREGLQMIAKAVTPKTETTGNMARDVAMNTPRIAAETLSEVAPGFVSRGSMLTAGGSKVVGAFRPLASAVRQLGFKGAEQLSALAPKNEGALEAAYRDSTLIKAPAKKVVGQLYERAKGILKPQAAKKIADLKQAEKVEQEAVNLEQARKYLMGKAKSPVASQVESKTAGIETLSRGFQNTRIIKLADKLADQGKLDPLMAMRAKRAANALRGSKSYDQDRLIEMINKFEKIEKTSPDFAVADATYKRSAMADALRNLAPQNSKGGASTMKTAAMAVAGKFLAPAFSPFIQE